MSRIALLSSAVAISTLLVGALPVAAQAPAVQQQSTPIVQQSPPATTNPPATAQPQQAAPRPALPPAPVVFDPPLVDLGVVRPNQRANGQVIMRNAGAESLFIRDSVASCSCTSVTLKNVHLAPGQEIAVPIRFNGQGRVADKTLAIKFAIEGYSVTEVPIRVKIESPVVIEPSSISALPDKGVPVTEGTFVVRSVDGTSFRVLAVNGEAPQFVDFNPAVDQPRQQYTISWSVASFDPVTCMNGIGKRMPGWYLIETDHPEVPILDMEVRNDCNSRARAGVPAAGQNWLTDQKAVMIGVLKAGESTEFALGVKQLNRRTPLGALVNSVRSESPDIDVELVRVLQEGDTYEMQVKVTAKGEHRGALYAPIRFYSPDFDCPVVVLGKVVD